MESTKPRLEILRFRAARDFSLITFFELYHPRPLERFGFHFRSVYNFAIGFQDVSMSNR